MRLDEVVAWYQKKIGTYDKQQWEKTVEQKILDGFSGVTLKTAKLKTELIDVDLVRGSTFPKAKSKQSLLTVIRLAVLRYLFLPIYTKWWVRQTSPNVFALLLMLYVAQMISWAIYTFHVNRPANNETVAAEETAKEHVVSLAELLIPMALSLLLSLIHSQIVATNTASNCKSKHRRVSNTSQSDKPRRAGEHARTRRRKKLVKVRSQEFVDANTQQRKSPCSSKKPHVGMEIITKTYNKMSIDTKSTTTTNVDQNESCGWSSAAISVADTNSNNSKTDLETFHTTSAIFRKSHTNNTDIMPHALSSPPSNKCLQSDVNNSAISTLGCPIETQKKRNVNWHSPIHNYATETKLQTLEKQQQTSPQSLSSTSTTNETQSSENITGSAVSPYDIDCTVAPLDSTSNTSSLSGSPTLDEHIDESVKEFFDELINRTAVSGGAGAAAAGGLSLRRHIGDDDGFESLNGKSSSGEETPHSPFPIAAPNQPIKNQLRLRLNVPTSEAPDAELSVGHRRKVPLSSESEDYKLQKRSISSPISCDVYQQSNQKKPPRTSEASSEETEEEGDDGETVSSPASLGHNSNYNECTTSATEWLGVTTNSEECSYSSELENSDHFKNAHLSDEDGYDIDFTPTTILNAHGSSDRISCSFWDQREFKKAQMSVLEISSCIIDRVESMPETKDYIYIGVFFSFLLSLIPPFCRLCDATIDSDNSSEINFFDVPMLLWEKSASCSTILQLAFGKTQWERAILVIGILQRLCLTIILFIIFAVAERTFKQRFLYAKLFSHLTSSRRARKSNLPHFRLNKVRNIKTWLSVRSYLKKRGPQRSVDVIISAAFIVTLLLLAFLSVEWLKDSVHLHSHLNLEALLWSTTIGIFLLRFMTLGNKIHQKYRSVSVLITEQINLYLQIEQKPKKKEELMVSNSVLKLAVDLLKELETPFKISGLSANPYLFTTIKVVILSALSGVLSEILGFKLKLHKIKIK